MDPVRNFESITCDLPHKLRIKRPKLVETVDQVAFQSLTECIGEMIPQPNQFLLEKSKSVNQQMDQISSAINAKTHAITFACPETEDDLGSRQTSAKRKRDVIIWTEEMQEELKSTRQQGIGWPEVVVRVSKIAGRKISQNSCIMKLQKIEPGLIATQRGRYSHVDWPEEKIELLKSLRAEKKKWKEIAVILGISRTECHRKLQEVDRDQITPITPRPKLSQNEKEFLFTQLSKHPLEEIASQLNRSVLACKNLIKREGKNKEKI